MITKTLSKSAQETIDQYLHFKIGSPSNLIECSVPYFNNKTIRARASIRSLIGKGSPKEIYEEVQSIIVKNHVDIATVTSEALKKVLTDNNIGIDCSAFAYYLLNSESIEIKKGSLSKQLHFPNAHGLLGKIKASLRPIENCDVATFADNTNSKIVLLRDAKPGDIITMLGGPDTNDRNHILVIYQIDYDNYKNDAPSDTPTKLYFTHSIAYPEDGIYGTGIKNGTIEILNADEDLLEQTWIENGKTNTDSIIFLRGQKSKTELRRLHFLC